MKKVGPTVFMCKTNYHVLSESKLIGGIHTSLDVYYRVQLNRYFASKWRLWHHSFHTEDSQCCVPAADIISSALSQRPGIIQSSLIQNFFFISCRMRFCFQPLCIGNFGICFMYMYGFTTLSNDVRITIGDLHSSTRPTKGIRHPMNGSNREFQLVQQCAA